jgi:hypothetical protein
MRTVKICYLSDVFGLIVGGMYSGAEIVCCFGVYTFKAIRRYNFDSHSLSVVQRESLLFYCKLSKFMSLSFVELGFLSHLVQFTLCLMLHNKMCVLFVINNTVYVN